MAGSGPAGAGGEAAGKGLGAPEGPSIPLLGPPAPVPRFPSFSRLAAPPRRDHRAPPEPDAVSATFSSASGMGPQRAGRAPRPAPLSARASRPAAAARLRTGPREAAPGRLGPEGWARRGLPRAAPGARTPAGSPAAQPRVLSGVWAALELYKVLDAAFVAGLLRRGLLSRISASSPSSSTSKTKWKPYRIFF